MEVDDQSQRDIELFHVAELLRLRDGKNFFDGFAFYKQTPIDQEIKAESHLALKLLVPDDYALLILDHVVSQLEFHQRQNSQALLVNRFE